MDILQYPVFPLGKEDVTLASLLFLIISLILLFYLSAKFRNLLQNRILARYNIDIGIRQAISTIIRYVILVAGLVIIIQSAGIDLSFLAILAG
ncbi:MAG: mechanosensitive ion channel family protein, partial [Bacteroidetes bacterium]